MLLEKEVDGQSVLGRVSLTGSNLNDSLDDIELIEQIGYCGVVNTQLKVLKAFSTGETFKVCVTIESTLRAYESK